MAPRGMRQAAGRAHEFAQGVANAAAEKGIATSIRHRLHWVGGGPHACGELEALMALEQCMRPDHTAPRAYRIGEVAAHNSRGARHYYKHRRPRRRPRAHLQ